MSVHFSPGSSRFREKLWRGFIAVLLVGASLTVVGVTPSAAVADTISVSTNIDVAANDGLCSLREAIVAANTDTASGAALGECPAGSGADTIELNAPGPYILGSALFAFANDVTVNGNGNTVDGAGSFGVFDVWAGTVEFSQITITNGSALSTGGGLRVLGGVVTVSKSTISGNTAPSAGGGISVSVGATLTVTDSTISGNTASGTGGGGIANSGTLDVAGSTVSGNTANFFGGGIRSAGVGSSLSVVDSTVSGNVVSTTGGGIYNSAGSAVVMGSTVSGNSSNSSGGGISNLNSGTLDVLGSTVSGNTGTLGGGIITAGVLRVVFSTVTKNIGGGVAASSPTAAASVGGSIIASNAGDDLLLVGGAAPFVSDGFNVIGDGSGAGAFIALGDVTGVPADAGSLADNGGPTLTHALFASSAAVDRVTGVLSPDLGVDQRGVARPQGVAKDSGAFERSDVLTVLASPCAVYDSRTATAPGLGGPLTGAQAARTVQVSGALTDQGGAGSCVPSGASAVVFTISAVDAASAGNLRLSAAGVVPNGGVVNYAGNGLNNANTVTVALNGAGEVDVKSNVGTTDVRLVAVGYYSVSTTGLRFTPLTPCAAVDTRASQGATGAFVGPFAAGAAFPDVDVVGNFPTGQGGDPTELDPTRSCGVPVSAVAVVVNLVAVNSTGGSGFLSIGTGGVDPIVEAATPFAVLGMNNATTAIVNLSLADTLSIDIDALTGSPSTQIRVVVSGYLESSGADYFGLTPCAGFDTRSIQGATGTFEGLGVGGQTTTYQITGEFPTGQGGDPTEIAPTRDCGVPEGASAVLVNLVAANPDAPGNFRAFATGTTPSGGLLNFADLTPPMNNANAVIIPLSALGQLDLFTNGGPAGIGIPITQARGVILGYYN